MGVSPLHSTGAAGMGTTASRSSTHWRGGHCLPPALCSPATQSTFSFFFFFCPMVRNWASLLFISHMGSQMDGGEGAG